ncbi:MAG: FAD-binding oxidoreductase, partial [Xanthomonadales bacterium]|nr:FAD-binding oxidoreductase [Xanthomonadales bacterium]
PVFAPGYLYGAVRERRGGDLDVDALLQAYLRLFRRRGGELFTSHPVQAIERRGQRWRISAGDQSFETALLVNAAGAWADAVAALAGLPALGLRPLRRTAFTIDPPAGLSVGEWPEMVDVAEEFYFKPEAGRILVSPADETPVEPGDAQPEELDVARGVDRFETATGLNIRRVNRSWAGLRTFAPDRLFVVGFDPRAEGFFWLAGQGGYGIQSAPSIAQLTRYLVTGNPLQGDFSALADHAEGLSPLRLIGRAGQSR